MLLSNPFASPLLPTLGTAFLGLFGGSLLALLIAARGHWQTLSDSVLFSRWRTWLVIAPLFSVAALSGPLPLALCVAAICVQGCREYAYLAGVHGVDRVVLLGAAVCIPLASVALSLDAMALVILALPLAASLPTLVQQDVDRGAGRLGGLAFGLWYLPVSLSLSVLLVREPRGGPGLLLALGLAVALSDIGAFTCGRLLGGRQLAARLSPSKTLAGVVGNVIGAAVGLALLGPLAPGAPLPALLVVVACGAVWGDLLESLLKRNAGAKDAGHWLPGFGGMLDRADSLLVVLPLAFVIVTVSA
jgi:phosphatidate cytidylyltransferase